MSQLESYNKENSDGQRSSNWMKGKFETIIEDDTKKRRCLSPDCKKVYEWGKSHTHLKTHYIKEHQFTSSPTMFLLNDDYILHLLIKLFLFPPPDLCRQ